MQKRMAVVVLSRLKIKAILLQCSPIHKLGNSLWFYLLVRAVGIHVAVGVEGRVPNKCDWVAPLTPDIIVLCSNLGR